jgi:glucokinase
MCTLTHDGSLGGSSEAVAMGIDLGGTKIAAGLVSFPAAKLLARQVIPTLPERGGEAVLRDLVALANAMREQAKEFGVSLRGIGVGIAELVNLQGEISSNYLLDWRPLRAREVLSRVAPTRFESDVRAPALAEALYGAGRQFSNFVFLNVGTGISHSLVIDGKPYCGAHGHALIVGSGPLTSECETCGAVQNQVLEQFAAGPSLVARYNQRAHAALTSAQQVTAASASGDRIAEEVVLSAGRALGNSVGFLVNVLDPQAIIVGGGLGLSGGHYWDAFVSSARKHIWSEHSQQLPIVHAALGADAGIIGAAAAITGKSG